MVLPYDSKLWSQQQADNISVSNGKLVIALKKEEAGKKHYTGGGVISTRQFQYGYYEASFKVPPGAGWHTSFWTMDYNHKNTGPMGKQEIDICEQDSVKTTKYSAGVIAWDQKGRNYGTPVCPDARSCRWLSCLGLRIYAGQREVLFRRKADSPNRGHQVQAGQPGDSG